MTLALGNAPLKTAFDDPVFDSQAVFRRVMSAFAYPGRIAVLDRHVSAPDPLSQATTALCLTLADFETPIWLDKKAKSTDASGYLRFHCGAPVTDDAHAARFAICADLSTMPGLCDFEQGEHEYPDRSATLILQVPSLLDGPEMTWSGPGIKETVSARIAGLPDWFWSDWDLNHQLYPLGVDIIFASGSSIIGLPRSIKVRSSK